MLAGAGLRIEWTSVYSAALAQWLGLQLGLISHQSKIYIILMLRGLAAHQMCSLFVNLSKKIEVVRVYNILCS